MSASSSTTHYQLPVYEPDDITSWLTDFNGAMEKIDTAIYEAAQSGGGGSPINVVQTTGQSTTDVMSQKAVTDALPEVLQATGSSQTATMSQDAITKAISGGSGSSGIQDLGLCTVTAETVAGLQEKHDVKAFKLDEHHVVVEGYINLKPTYNDLIITCQAKIQLPSSLSNFVPTNIEDAAWTQSDRGTQFSIIKLEAVQSTNRKYITNINSCSFDLTNKLINVGSAMSATNITASDTLSAVIGVKLFLTDLPNPS